ncbi:SEC-C domain-containing protein [Desulfobacterota bacterium AH_259_B03_O07]|nr:SEC-C domain-containing protein [Desulfobacterota bacterium AH_259_B03_O07]
MESKKFTTVSKKLGRNDPCPCGSGKKFKNCCLDRIRIISPTNITNSVKKIIGTKLSPVEPYLHLLPSIVWKGYRWRTVFNRLYYRPTIETFHEFLINIIKWAFGKTWWRQQIKLDEKARHVVVKWAYAFAEVTKRYTDEAHKIDSFTYETEAPGPAWALLSLGYDLFCLQTKNKLPNFMIQKLRTNKEFQSTRYEIATAAIMARAGFEISYLDELARRDKHCEFISSHKTFKIRVGVEAKSRRRKGVIHEQGNYDYTEDYKGILELVRRAKKQKPRGLPFFIFVDLNLPHCPGMPFYKKPWFKDIKRILEELGIPTTENPEPFTALIPTNFAHHYGTIDEVTYPGEYALIVSLYPEIPISDPRIFDILLETLKRYDRIPSEV